jgi:hypothetical protein
MMQQKHINIIVVFFISGIVFSCVAFVFESNNFQYAEAHVFTPDNMASFISMVNEALVELNLAKSNFPSNATLAIDHADYASKLMDNAYYLDDEIVDDNDFIKRYNQGMNNSSNSTIIGVAVANIVDDILREYGRALDVQFDLTNMSNMNMNSMADGDDDDNNSTMAMSGMADDNSSMDMSTSMDMMGSNNSSSSSMAMSGMADDNNSSSNMDMSSMNTSSSSTMMNMDSEMMERNYSIVNTADYQSAQAFSDKLLQLFEEKFKAAASINDTAVISKIQKNLADLKNLIDNKAQAMDVMMLVHGQLHPNLQIAYGLKLKQQ